MPRNKTNEVITIFGQSGAGKSSWVHNHIVGLSRFVLWDTMDEYDGYQTFTDSGSLYEHLVKNHDGLFQVVFNCMDENEEQVLSDVCEMVMAVGNCFFILEEVDLYATPQHIPFELRTMVKAGRHYDVSMIFISQRPAMVHRLITSQSRRIICFQMLEPADLRHMRQRIGSVADDLQSLEALNFIDWNRGQKTKGAIKW